MHQPVVEDHSRIAGRFDQDTPLAAVVEAPHIVDRLDQGNLLVVPIVAGGVSTYCI